MKPTISSEMMDYLYKTSEKFPRELTNLFPLDFIWSHPDRKWNWGWVAKNCGMQKYIEKADIFLSQTPPVFYKLPDRFDMATFEEYLPLLNLYKSRDCCKWIFAHLSYQITTEVYYKYQDWPDGGWDAGRVAYEEWCLQDLDETTDTDFNPDDRLEFSLKQALRHPWRKWDYDYILNYDLETNSFDFILENLDVMMKHDNPYSHNKCEIKQEIMSTLVDIADIDDILKHSELDWDYEDVFYREDFDFEKDFRRFPEDIQMKYLHILIEYLNDALPGNCSYD